MKNIVNLRALSSQVLEKNKVFSKPYLNFSNIYSPVDNIDHGIFVFIQSIQSLWITSDAFSSNRKLRRIMPPANNHNPKFLYKAITRDITLGCFILCAPKTKPKDITLKEKYYGT
jgi:hypothetical protein